MQIEPLDRYSKQRGIGDQASGGRDKLLKSTTGLRRLEIALRETLQNSWDAADDGWYPAYGVRIHPADSMMRSCLKESVFTDLPESLNVLRDSLNDPQMHVVEIFDRGTTGLNGPFIAGQPTEPGEPNNFNSFVFDIGTTKASEGSGGTFGFGKTAAFEISAPHSVVYWSRCVSEEEELQYRLIASSLHDEYAENDLSFTGAHWWGRGEDQSIVPLIGDQARILGEQLFRTRFGDEETGTSILIIDPLLDDDPAEKADSTLPTVRSSDDRLRFVRQIENSIAHSAWPKTIPFDDDQPPMVIEVHNDLDALNTSSTTRALYSDFARALVEIRREQGAMSAPPDEGPLDPFTRSETFPIKLKPTLSAGQSADDYFNGRTDNVVGHVHLTASLSSAEATGDAGSAPSNALCMMRSSAELVVIYEEFFQDDESPISWHGVFKPTPECDVHFAKSEPPTHDRWTGASADNAVSRYVVDRSLAQIRSKVSKFLATAYSDSDAQGRSVRRVAQSLRSFLPRDPVSSDVKPDPSPRIARKGKSSKPHVKIIAHSSDSSGVEQRVRVHISGPNAEALEVKPRIFARTSEGAMLLEESEVAVHWNGAKHAWTSCPGWTLYAVDGEEAELVMSTQAPLVLELDFSVQLKGK